MSDWWSARTRRERWLLGTTAILMAVFLAWFGAYRPVAAVNRAAERRYDRAIEESARARRALAAIRALGRVERQPVRVLPVAEAVASTSAATGVTLSRIEPDGEGGVQVAVAGVSSTSLFAWLAALQRDQGVTPVHLTVIKDDQGALSADATFRAGE